MFRLLPAIFLSTLLMLPGIAVADGFLSMIEDLPLPQGLAEDVDAAMVFESAQGRVASAEAFGPMSVDDVRAFYQETLPQLGWAQQADGSYVRAKDRLRLDISRYGGEGTAVRFEIGPVGP